MSKIAEAGRVHAFVSVIGLKAWIAKGTNGPAGTRSKDFEELTAVLREHLTPTC